MAVAGEVRVTRLHGTHLVVKVTVTRRFWVRLWIAEKVIKAFGRTLSIVLGCDG